MITEIGNGLIAVKVAPDAKNYRFGHKVFGQTLYPKDLCYDTDENIWKVGNETVPELKYKIIGEVTKDHIGFDCEPYVGKDYSDVFGYINYVTGIYSVTNKEESFYSLLSLRGLYFVNPIKADDKHISDYINQLSSEWQSYQDSLVEKLLIIQKIK